MATPTPLRPLAQPPARREQPIAKAARLIAQDRVKLDQSARVYVVQGETGTYRVIASDEGIFCPCAARTALCAHVLAAVLVRQRGKNPPEGLLKDLGVVA